MDFVAQNVMLKVFADKKGCRIFFFTETFDFDLYQLDNPYMRLRW